MSRVNIKVTRRDIDGIYQIQSLTGAVFVHVKERGSEDIVRVGDEVSEAEVKAICDVYRNVTITRIKG
jgi:hypothetical protein